MKAIATLTMNPTIDVAYDVPKVFHTHKIRVNQEYHNPGGGGINVARVYVRLGGNARCYYLSGGATGIALDGLLDLHNLVRTRIAIAGETRVAANVLEQESRKEYRFVPAGPTVNEAEWQAALDMLAEVECDYLVASGSLPPGVPEDFYARLAALMKPRGIRFVLDSSGAALWAGLEAGGVHLAKPSAGELQQLVGRELKDVADIGQAATELVGTGKVEMLAVTMGHEGAVLAHAGGTMHVPAVPIEAGSTVGAGDSFLAGMLYGLSDGQSPEKAFRLGMAAGTAAVLRPGTDLAQQEDIEAMLGRLGEASAPAKAGA
ncbi:MAG: 1-phosphofructokinase family hexose kinase [Sphingobium sp.]|nr:1-phosphofructokinase family hexose kinase [Sphingobium sp.]